ncbi:MAG: hypothetical protein CVU92_01665 [Firmicutes bacterium HGW-Firmicutes-17]|nr:MAG: hypothetical protein CVU92_01665 [Firmicutes bacterium HGW-Firmicutes-17]
MSNVLDLAVIASFITLLGVLFQYIVAIKSKNITEERRKWRDRLKELAVMANSKCQIEVDKAIIELKTRINSFGYGSEKDYLKDTHIWEILNKEEHKVEDKKKLTIFISLLLKYDWERCKLESSHWFFIPYEILSGVCFLGLSAYIALVENYPIMLENILLIIGLSIVGVEICFKVKRINNNNSYKNAVESVYNQNS